MDPASEIRTIYYAATRTTITKDVERAIDLLKLLPTEEARERVAVYMDGLSQMRSEWATSSTRRASSGPPAAKARGYSGPSKAPGRRAR